MSKSPSDFTDNRVRHLEMIQGVIDRMANASAWMKRLAIIVVGGTAVLAVRSNFNANALPMLAVILTVIFWLMDARYHQQERWFRVLFDMVRMEDAGKRPDFRMTASEEIRSRSNFSQSVFSWSSSWYYGALTIFLVLAWWSGT